MRQVLLAELTREQVAEIAPSATVVIPVAATEQHGPHLPINVDTTICEYVALQGAQGAATEERPVVVAPMLPFGISDHHRPFAGVLSLSSATFVQVLYEVVHSLMLSGFTRLFVLNGHGGNQEAITTLARDVTNEHDVYMAAASYWTIAGSKLRDVVDKERFAWVPGHAGAFETSLMLALREDLVRLDRFSGKSSATSAEFVAPGVLLHRRRWLHEIDGYTDTPSLGDAEAGRKALEVIVKEVASALRAFAAVDPKRLS